MNYDKSSIGWNSYFAYRNIGRIWMNEELKQDYNKTQLNSTKQKHESWLIDHTPAALMA